MGKYGNLDTKLSLGLSNWRRASEAGLTQIRVTGKSGNKLVTRQGHEFLNMVSCSYLGLDTHPAVLEGATSAIRDCGALLVPVSRARIALALLDDAEMALSELFNCEAVVTLSCYVASASILPVLSSGHMTGGQKPTMVFDKYSHFSMNVMRAACGDETEVLSCNHADLNFLEDACKTNKIVAYVGDGAYSLGGSAPVKELLALQDRYGMFLYLDDSHSLSAYGDAGRGYVRGEIDSLNERTIVVASLGKAFGAVGGLVMMGDGKHRDLIDYGGGPVGWSQTVNSSGLGAILGSVEVHRSTELQTLQTRLWEVMKLIDKYIPTRNSGSTSPIRVVEMPTVEDAVITARELFDSGFYVSAVFFPIVPQGTAGLRLMGRADMTEGDIRRFAEALAAASQGDRVTERAV